MNRIEELHRQLTDSWSKNQRVEALKIAIQCAKMMLDTTVIRFYPSMFVLLTEVLETFGKLVFERLKLRSEEIQGKHWLTIFHRKMLLSKQKRLAVIGSTKQHAFGSYCRAYTSSYV